MQSVQDAPTRPAHKVRETSMRYPVRNARKTSRMRPYSESMGTLACTLAQSTQVSLHAPSMQSAWVPPCAEKPARKHNRMPNT